MQKNIIGINIGSKNTIIGTYNKGVFEVVLSDISSRTIPTIVSFEDRQRKYGEMNKKNYRRTIIYPNRWLGLKNIDNNIFKDESKFTDNCPTLINNNLQFQIKYKNKVDYFSSECLMGLFFDKIKNIWLKKKIDTTNIVLSVPDYYSTLERTAMLEAIKIGGLNCNALLNESSAITLAYVFKN